jgi:hypothetical protein
LNVPALRSSRRRRSIRHNLLCTSAQGLACLCRERRRDRGALVNRGYNPGGVSLNLNARRWQPFEEETIWSYALFTPATLLDDRLTLNSNLFYMDFKNAQYTIPVAILPGWSR